MCCTRLSIWQPTHYGEMLAWVGSGSINDSFFNSNIYAKMLLLAVHCHGVISSTSDGWLCSKCTKLAIQDEYLEQWA